MSSRFEFHMIFVRSSLLNAADLIDCARHTPSEDYHTQHVVGAIRWLKCAKTNLAMAEAAAQPAPTLKPLRKRRLTTLAQFDQALAEANGGRT